MATSENLDLSFYEFLRNELLETQKARLKLTLQKLTFVVSLLGVGSALTPCNNLNYLILLAPIVAIIFDFYITGENYGIRRIGIFLKNIESASLYMRKWEFLLNKKEKEGTSHRDKFALWAKPFTTILVCAISLIIACMTPNTNKTVIIWWLFIILLPLILSLYFFDDLMRKKLRYFEDDLIKIRDEKNYSEDVFYSLLKKVDSPNPNKIGKLARIQSYEEKAKRYGYKNNVEHELLIVLYAYEDALTNKNNRTTRANRTWPMVKKDGIIKAAEKAVSRKFDPLGYKTLVELGLKELTFEAVINKYPESFNKETVDKARARLKDAEEYDRDLSLSI